jgi:hypothetical protein
VKIFVFVIGMFWATLIANILLSGSTPSEKNEIHKIGEFRYVFVYTDRTLGEVLFPPDDKDSLRYLRLPIDPAQRELSLQHEIIHACIHNHRHNFKTKEELDKHIDRKWDFSDEENLATVLGLCLAESDIQ